jgi:hypothetical protein
MVFRQLNDAMLFLLVQLSTCLADVALLRGFALSKPIRGQMANYTKFCSVFTLFSIRSMILKTYPFYQIKLKKRLV